MCNLRVAVLAVALMAPVTLPVAVIPVACMAAVAAMRRVSIALLLRSVTESNIRMQTRNRE